MKNIRPWAAISLTLFLTACAGLQLPTTVTTSTGNNDLDASALVDARLQIPALPPAPRLPKLDLMDAAQFVNQKGKFRGTPTGLFAKSDLVTVMGGGQLVGAESSAGKYVGDLLNAALQARQIPLVDRDYRVVKREEANSLAKTNSSMYERFIVLPEEETVQTLRESRAVSHVVVVHSVTIPNNPVTIQLPREIKADEWARYEKERDAYVSGVNAYNKAVRDYDAKLADWTKANWKANAKLVDKASEGTSVEEFFKDTSVRRWVERQPRVRARGVKLPENHEKPAAPQRTEAQPVAPFGLFQLPNREAENQNQSAAGPQLVELNTANIFSSIDQALASMAAQPVISVSAYQAAISVRVIELKSSKAVWFGIANAQNLSYAEAMSDTIEAIANKIVQSN